MLINPEVSSGVRYAGTGVAPVSHTSENRLRERQTGTISVSGYLKIKSRQSSRSRARASRSSPQKTKIKGGEEGYFKGVKNSHY